MSDLSESLALNLSNVQHLDKVRDVSARSMAVDTVQRSTTLDDLLITNPKSTVIFPVRDPAAEQHHRQRDVQRIDGVRAAGTHGRDQPGEPGCRCRAAGHALTT